MAREDRYRDDRRERDRDDRREARSRERDDNRDRDRRRDDDRGRGRDSDRGRSRDNDRGRGGRTYAHHNKEAVRKHADQSGGSFEGIFTSNAPKTWRPKEGENAIRIFPPTWENYQHYGYEVYVHYRVGASGSTYICPRKHGGTACAACEESAALKAAGEEEDAIQLAVKKNYVYYIIDRDARKPELMLWQVGWRQDKDIADASVNKRKNEYKYIDDPNAGHDVIVKRTGTTRTNTRYTYQIDPDATPIHDDPDIQDDLMKEVEDYPIDSFLKFVDNDVIARDLEGTQRKRDDDEEDERGSRGRDRDDDRRGRGGRDDDDRGGRSSRGRDRDEDDRGSSRGRGRDDDEEDTTSRRGERLRGGDRDERDDRRGRGRDDDGDTEDRDTRRSSRERGDDDERSSRRSRDDDEETRSERRRDRDDEERPSRGRDRDEDRGHDRGRDDDRSERSTRSSRDDDRGRERERDEDRSRRR